MAEIEANHDYPYNQEITVVDKGTKEKRMVVEVIKVMTTQAKGSAM